MTAYKRPDRPTSGYVISPTLPAPWYRVGPWQTGLHRKRDAEQVERWLHEMARTWPAVVDAVTEGQVRVMDAWVAYRRGTLAALLEGIGDPPLEEAVADYRPHCADERARAGLDQLIQYAPDGARLSDLTPATINTVYARALETRAPNSVQRSLHRAVRELLTHHLGRRDAERRMEGVRVPRARDERDVSLRPEEVRMVVASAPNDRFGWMVALAILTTADRGPLLRLTPRHYDEPVLTIPDRKARERWRKIRLPEPAQAIMRLAQAGMAPDERLFPWTPWQARKLWDATREAAGLPWLRFKDLRHLLPSALAAMGVDRREIQAVLGHASGSRVTDRYVHAAGNTETLARAAQELGLGTHLKREA